MPNCDPESAQMPGPLPCPLAVGAFCTVIVPPLLLMVMVPPLPPFVALLLVSLDPMPPVSRTKMPPCGALGCNTASLLITV
ncbi:hypothetical protein D3C86_851910 [compost metagenome]